MTDTGKTKAFRYNGRPLMLYNQSCPEWTHSYAIPEAEGDLHTSGCGIFAVAHLIDYICGSKPDVEALADFAVLKGARAEDGTDRPTLLEAMEKSGRLAPYQLEYKSEGLVNNSEALWQTLLLSGAALADLRPGHIVAVVDWRIVDGEKQVLIIDSSCDSVHKDVTPCIRECVHGSEMINVSVSENGSVCGTEEHYAMYWVPYTKPFDVTLLHRIDI